MPSYFFRGIPAVRDRSEARRMVNSVAEGASRKARDIAVWKIYGQPGPHDRQCEEFRLHGDVEGILSRLGYPAPIPGAVAYSIEYEDDEQKILSCAEKVRITLEEREKKCRSKMYKKAREDAWRDAKYLTDTSEDELYQEYNSKLEDMYWGGTDSELTPEGVYEIEYMRCLCEFAPNMAAAAAKTYGHLMRCKESKRRLDEYFSSQGVVNWDRTNTHSWRSGPGNVSRRAGR